jgi:hypothetical protein
MEHLSQSASRALAQSSESAQPPKHGSPKAKIRAAAVWSSMLELYGPAFTAAYGDTPSHLWLAAISDLTDDECRKGLTSLARQAREYPANLTQFMAACKPSPGVRYLGRPMTEEQKAEMYLPRPSVPVEKIDGWLAKMRARLV